MNPSDPIGKPGKTGSLFARLFSRVFTKKDTIDLLRALVEFSSLKKNLVVYDKEDEYRFVRTRLKCSPSKRQFIYKCSDLKALYRSRLIKGETAAGGGGVRLTGDDAAIFELSEKLWGGEVKRLAMERERERSGRAASLEDLKAELGLGESGGGVHVELAGLVMESGLEAGKKSSNMVSGKNKRKRKDELGNVDRMAENGAVDEVLNHGNGKFGGLAKWSAKSGLEESGQEVRRKKEKKKRKGEEGSVKRRSWEVADGEMANEGSGNLATGEDSSSMSGLVNESSSRLAEHDADSQSRKKEKHKVDNPGEFESFSGSGSANEESNGMRKKAKPTKLRMNSGSEDRKLARTYSKEENYNKGDEKSPNLMNLSEKGSGSEKSSTQDDCLVKSAKRSASSRKKEKRQG